MRGETVALKGEDPKSLLFPILKIIAVYGYTTHGERVDYVDGIDFVQVGDKIARTKTSSIFDFDRYEVTTQSGQFDFSVHPRNPPLILFRQVYVDYEGENEPSVVIAGVAPVPIAGRVICMGDSITAAGNTLSLEVRGTDDDGYSGLLREQLAGCEVENWSRDGATIAEVFFKFSRVVKSPPRGHRLVYGNE